jgi:hypothetical protein
MPRRCMDRALREGGTPLVTARLKEWLGFRKGEAPRHPTAPEPLPVDELQYIKNETDYIRAAVDSTEGLLKPEDLERVIALTRVLEKSNRRRLTFLAATDERTDACQEGNPPDYRRAPQQ